jgi:hypothetical protein
MQVLIGPRTGRRAHGLFTASIDTFQAATDDVPFVTVDPPAIDARASLAQ